MPSSFFTFQQGSDSRALPPPDAHSLRYGRFRAFSPAPDHGLGAPPAYGSPYGYGTLADDDDGDGAPDTRWWLDRTLISPRRATVRWLVGVWWRRWAVLVVLPAALVRADSGRCGRR